jgi:hypothetical protein
MDRDVDVAFVKTAKDYHYLLHRSKLPFRDIVLLPGGTYNELGISALTELLLQVLKLPTARCRCQRCYIQDSKC